MDEYVELVSEALLEKVAEAICEKLKRQLVQEKYKFFCTKFRKFYASLFWDLYPLCAVRCAVQVRAHLGLNRSMLLLFVNKLRFTAFFSASNNFNADRQLSSSEPTSCAEPIKS